MNPVQIERERERVKFATIRSRTRPSSAGRGTGVGLPNTVFAFEVDLEGEKPHGHVVLSDEQIQSLVVGDVMCRFQTQQSSLKMNM